MLVVSCDDVRRNLFFNFLVGLTIIFDKLPLLSRLLCSISSGKMSSPSSLEILFETYDHIVVTALSNSTSRVGESTERVETHLLQNDALQISIPLFRRIRIANNSNNLTIYLIVPNKDDKMFNSPMMFMMFINNELDHLPNFACPAAFDVFIPSESWLA